MKTILKLLKDEIQKVSSEEKINIGKMNELLQIYQRIESYTITSVNQIPLVRQLVLDEPNIAFPVTPRNETATMYDGIVKAFQEMYKSQKPDVSGIRISRYIEWYRFVCEDSKSYSVSTTNKAIDIRFELYDKILDEIKIEMNKEILTPVINKDENKENI